MGLVTVFWPLMTTGDGRLVFQTAGEKRFVVDCNVKPVEGDGQETTTVFSVSYTHLTLPTTPYV